MLVSQYLVLSQSQVLGAGWGVAKILLIAIIVFIIWKKFQSFFLMVSLTQVIQDIPR
jgi:hypothetical protein